MPRHDPISSSPYDLGREACMTTPKSVRPRDVCPDFAHWESHYAWTQGFAEEKADAYVVFNLMMKRAN